jgi:hypothetical protein
MKICIEWGTSFKVTVRQLTAEKQKEYSQIQNNA